MSGRWRQGALAVAFAGIAGLTATALVVGSLFGGSGEPREAEEAPCVGQADAATHTVRLDADQMRNARTIIATGRGMDVPTRGLVIAIATAMQESTLRNLHYGDRDSVGLFQQRPSSGWGSVAQLTTPPIAASKFYSALLRVPGWPQMPLTRAAQAVQRSAFPFAYARWESLATSVVRANAGVGLDCGQTATVSLPSGAVGAMLRVAMAQQGDPYVWGATGPDAFDCSGLIVYSWRVAGYRLTVRTADQMYRLSRPIPWGQERPGDLLFGSFGTRVPGAGHVMIVVRPGLAVQAPSAGRNVVLTNYSAGGGYRVGRLPSSALIPLSRAA